MTVRKLVALLLAAVGTAACADHTVLTGPDAEAAAERFEARVTAERDAEAEERLPLIYVDGQRVGDPPKAVLQDLSPADIERIEVMKGCHAVSRLGEDARHGVIVIYTKAYEGESLEFGVAYPELGEACRREFQREQARLRAERWARWGLPDPNPDGR
jgi:hypothetical protein